MASTVISARETHDREALGLTLGPESVTQGRPSKRLGPFWFLKLSHRKCDQDAGKSQWVSGEKTPVPSCRLPWLGLGTGKGLHGILFPPTDNSTS